MTMPCIDHNFADYAEKVHQNGYHIIPVKRGTKHPALGPDWVGNCWSPASLATMRSWVNSYDACNLGIACGRTTVAIDIDADNPQKVADIQALSDRIFGYTPLVRQGRDPRVALVYGCTEPIISRRASSIDVIGLGAQLVAFGTHPKSTRPYRWLTKETPATVNVSDLPKISNDDIERFYREVPKTLGLQQAGIGRLSYDRVNYTPPLSSISVMLKMLCCRTLRGEAFAQRSAQRILDRKYADTGTGLSIDVMNGLSLTDF